MRIEELVLCCYRRATHSQQLYAAKWIQWLNAHDDRCDSDFHDKASSAVEHYHEQLLQGFLGQEGSRDGLSEGLKRLSHELSSLDIEPWRTAIGSDLRDYFTANQSELDWRRRGITPTVDEYRRTRRYSGAVMICFSLCAAFAGVRLEAYTSTTGTSHAWIWQANDIICLENDLRSYERERVEGNVSNALGLAIAGGQSLPAAREALAGQLAAMEAGFVENVRRWKSEARPSTAWLEFSGYLSDWIAGNRRWSELTGRYRAPPRHVAKLALDTSI